MNSINNKKIRTDLAHESASQNGLKIEESEIDGVKISRVFIDEKAAEKLGKPPGNYVTMLCEEKNPTVEVSALSLILTKMLDNKSGSKKTLIAGLGNENITPDSLGNRTAAKVLATAHFKESDEFRELGLSEVYVIAPGVMAQTGIESAELIKLIADKIKPDAIIVIDSLACSERERLAKTIQITDTGISPGSGVKNQRKAFSSEVFGVPVIAVGVPTVIDMAGDSETLMLVPRDIDIVINHYSEIISRAINKTLNPTLDEADIENLLL